MSSLQMRMGFERASSGGADKYYRQGYRNAGPTSGGSHNYARSQKSCAAQDASRSGRDLYMSAQRGDTEGVLTALANGARWNWRHPKCDETALHTAAAQGHDEVVRLLLEAGAYVHTEDGDGNLALQKAAYGGHAAVLRWLLTADQHLQQRDRASLDWRNHFGHTALHAAA